MHDDDRNQEPIQSGREGFFSILLRGLIQDMVTLVMTFVVGTGVGAVLCLYFGAPLIFSLLGGVLVMAVYVAWDRM